MALHPLVLPHKQPRPVEEDAMNKSFTPVRVGRYNLPNRLVMAPMTRNRANGDGTPGELAAEYYAQRAGVGLIVTEGTQPSDDGQGYLATPGIYTPAHIAGWKKVTKAVHDKGGHVFIQIMHAGRMSHPDNTPHHRQAVAPSAIAPGAQMFTATGMKDIPAPRALTSEEVRQTAADFRHAARAAIEAGADGVEIHGANSYLIQQFIAPSANTRSDEYGGSIANRARFAIEVATAIAEEMPGAPLWAATPHHSTHRDNSSPPFHLLSRPAGPARWSRSSRYRRRRSSLGWAAFLDLGYRPNEHPKLIGQPGFGTGTGWVKNPSAKRSNKVWKMADK
jgi:hypothetical protein